MSTYEEKLERARRWRRENHARQALHGRKHMLKHRYGMTPENFDDQLAAQGDCCAICKGDTNGRWPNFAVDHDHDTGEPRGILCHRCNAGLGHFMDDPELLEAAGRYLRGRDWVVPQAFGRQLGLIEDAC